jgi:hypothetical protein
MHKSISQASTSTPGRIPEINRSVLWSTWKAVRKELANASLRDVIDYLDYDVHPEKWISVLLKQLDSGTYKPTTPLRFTLGKHHGFSRTMTAPNIPDLVLYRAIVDHLYSRLNRKEKRHVYFRRQFLEEAQKAATQAAQEEMQTLTEYKSASRSSFLNWLRYHQYRKHLLLEHVYPYFVLTDVSNFFDSILHSHIEEALRGVAVSPRMIGLLFFLLERLSIRQDYAGSHGISLPVDEFDCSRTLAHIVLFPHDEAITRVVGENAYVRWMDDQNIGVGSRAEGLRVLAEVGRSLGRLHLTPNTKKSRILSLSEARRHFHLDLNAMLDKGEQIWKGRGALHSRKMRLRKLTRQIWSKASGREEGEFGKVLKRLYRLAGFAEARFLRRRALRDILEDAQLAERALDYMRVTGSPAECINFVETLINSDEQVYADVSVAALECLLRVEALGFEARRIWQLAASLLKNELRIIGGAQCGGTAALLLFRFSDRRSIPLLRRLLNEKASVLSGNAIRAIALVQASYGHKEFAGVREIASKLLRNYLAGVVLMIERIRGYEDVPTRYANRLRPRFDSVGGKRFVDTRALLTVCLLALNKTVSVQAWIEQWRQRTETLDLSSFDHSLISRVLGRAALRIEPTARKPRALAQSAGQSN